MVKTSYFESPVGRLLLAAEEENLIGLWIENQKYYPDFAKEETCQREEDPVLNSVKEWLTCYFQGKRPDISELSLVPRGSGFRQDVWQILCHIPYGQVRTYGDIAKEIAKKYGRPSMSAQAVGGAVAHNPISIIIPCHRVVGTNGSLTGYAGGIEKKIWLLRHEGKIIPEER